MSDYELVYRYFPMADTGIGQEMGYENDAAFKDAMRKEREALAPELRETMDELDKATLRVMFGISR